MEKIKIPKIPVITGNEKTDAKLYFRYSPNEIDLLQNICKGLTMEEKMRDTEINKLIEDSRKYEREQKLNEESAKVAEEKLFE